jgi:hypothetical protein
MARTTRTRQDLASQAASRLTAVAAQLKPFARNTRAAATRGVHATRTWGAPRLERTGQVLQDSVAPKVASALSSAAERLDPGKPRHARWHLPAGIATVTAAASAAAAVVLRRRRPRAASSPAEQDGATPAAETSDGQATPSADADGTGTAS